MNWRAQDGLTGLADEILRIIIIIIIIIIINSTCPFEDDLLEKGDVYYPPGCVLVLRPLLWEQWLPPLDGWPVTQVNLNETTRGPLIFIYWIQKIELQHNLHSIDHNNSSLMVLIR